MRQISTYSTRARACDQMNLSKKERRPFRERRLNKQQKTMIKSYIKIDAKRALAFKILNLFSSFFEKNSATSISIYKSVYLSLRPFAFSTGYFSPFRLIFASIAAEISIPVIFAN